MEERPCDIARLEALRPRLEWRAQIIASIRNFFLPSGFLEIETPVRIKAPAPEAYIDALTSGNYFLRTSPELQMKRLLSAGYKKIFQIGSCFRKGENGRFHREEFTMLEWYEAGVDYNQLLNFLQDMLLYVLKQIFGRTQCRFNGEIINFQEWEITTVRSIFMKFAGISPEKALEDGIFEEALIDKIEPRLRKDCPVVLKDYPAELAALSRLKKDDNSLAERWELYLGGIEIANAYSELTDPNVLKKRFADSVKTRKSQGKTIYPEDIDFLTAVEHGMPECAGCALGLDRLIMVITDSSNLDDVMI